MDIKKIKMDCVTWWMRKLKNWHMKMIKNDNIENDSLAPEENLKDISGYEEALESALNNPSVKNIGVSGSYGSGKSSFLRTFENQHPEWKYLSISLANFKKKKELIKENGLGKIKGESHRLTEENNRDIERSILQQILYKVSEDKVPNSRFKRIKTFKNMKIILETLGVSTLIFSGILTIQPKILNDISFFKKIDVFKFINNEKYYLFFALAIFIMVSIIYLYRIIKYMLEFEISKLSVKNSGVELNKRSKSSILNDHLDEVLYFFEVTDYNVVVFEDLDRFVFMVK